MFFASPRHESRRVGIFVVLVFYFGLGFGAKADAATYYWYGGTGNWSDYTNHWSTNSGNSPSSSAPNAPLATDSVVFDASSGSGTATIDPASITVASFNASATSVAINDGGHSVTVNGNILITSTASRLISTGIWTQGASGNISNPQSGNYFKQLVIAGSGVTTTMTGAVWIGTVGGGFLTMGPGTINGAGQNLYLYNTTNDSLTVNNLNIGSALGAFYYTVSGANVTQKAFTLPNNFASVSINLNNLRNLTATGDFNFGNNGITVFNPATTGTPTNYLDMGASALTAGIIYIGTSNSNFCIKFGSSLLHSINGIQRTATGTANIVDMGSSTITSSGNINFTGINVTASTSTLVMTGTNSLTSAGQSLNNLTHSSSGTLTLSDNPTIGGNFTMSAGTLSPGATTVIMNGNGKTLTTNSQTLNNFEASGNTILGGSLALSGNLTIDSGKTFDTSGSNYPVSVVGNWTNSGTFTGNNSLVTLSGSGSQTITGSNTFYQLSASASSANRTLTFANGATQTISNALTLTGSGGNVLSLRSDSPTHQWNITPNGTRTVDFADIQDSNNTIVATPIVATNSIDSGNNTYWTITPSPLTVSAQAASSITKISATLNGNIIATGGINPSERGFNLYNGSACFGSIIQNPKDTGGSYSTGAYSKVVTGLSSVTQYSYTAYAVNSSGTSTSVCQSLATAGDVYYIVNSNNTWVRGSISSNKDIAQKYSTFGLTNNNNFNFSSTYLINSSTPNTITDYMAGTFLASAGDDATPINTANVGYFTANHGLNSPVITATTDKTSSDIGSVWQDSGGHQFVIAGVSGSGTETITLYSIPSGSPWTYALSISGTTLTWVSGGTHQGSITITSQITVQQFPAVKNIVNHILVDGVTEASSGSSGYASYVDMSEEFDVIDPSTINRTNNPFVWNDATGVWLHVKNVFRATAGRTVVHSTYTVLRPINLGYFGIIQVGAMTAPAYDHQYYYIPKTKPVSGYDFKATQLFDTAPASQISFNSTYIDDVNNPPDRQIIFLKKNTDSNYDIGFAFGYSPYGSTAASNRTCATTYASGCWWIYTSKKTYPVMDGGTGVINNTTYDAYAYRQFIDPTSYDIGKSAYWNNLNGHELVYVDYHRSATSDVTTLPSQFAGWNVKVIDSANIQTPQSNVSGDGTLALSTTGSNTYGYAVLEVYAPITTTASPAQGNYTTTQSVTLTCDDGAGVGCDKTYYTTDGTDPTTSSTQYSGVISIPSTTTLKFFSTDLNANTETFQTKTYIIDALAPTGAAFTINSGASQTNITAVTLNITCPTDAWTPVQMAYGNSAAPTNWTDCVTSQAHTLTSGDGSKTVYVRFKDGGGNTTSDLTQAITLDTTIPTITLTSPTEGSTVYGTTITVSADAADNIDVAGVQFQLDGANLGAEVTSGPYSLVWDTTQTTNGTHTLTAIARDASNLTTTSSPITVTVSNVAASSNNKSDKGSSKKKDTTPKRKIGYHIKHKAGETTAPFITIDAPRVGTTATNKNRSLFILAHARDASGIKAMVFSTDGKYRTKKVVGSELKYTYTRPSGFDRYPRVVYVIAYDNLGNQKKVGITLQNGKVVAVRGV